jgi:hypothetical protein
MNKAIVTLLSFIAVGIAGVGLLALTLVIIAARTASNVKEHHSRSAEVQVTESQPE